MFITVPKFNSDKNVANVQKHIEKNIKPRSCLIQWNSMAVTQLVSGT